jgi:uncharacterized RDD family membrane protein YckC
MEGIHIETAQHIQIKQRPASLGDRVLAYLFDSFILIVYVIMVSITAFGMLEIEDGSVALITALVLPFFLYHLLFEIFMNGQTPGKYALDIRVVKLDGSKASITDYIIRWLLRPIDLTISSGGVAVLSILLGGKGQRLGDMAAGTTVISLKQTLVRGEDLLVKVALTHKPKYPQVVNLTDAQIRQIKEIRAEALQTQDFGLLKRLAEKTGDMLQVSYETKSLEFINQVILDYEYFAQKEHGEG